MRDSVIVITGASSGIGAALAETVHARGALPVLVARRQGRLREVTARAGYALTLVGDMTNRTAVQRVVHDAIAAHGRIDCWVNNVGQGINRLPSELLDADIDRMMRVNVMSAMYGMQEVLPHFKSRGSGHIVNVSSMLGRAPFATFRSAYCGAKHFLNALTATFRAEIQATHPDIQVSLVSPGVVRTDFGLNALHGGPDSREIPDSQSAEEVAAVIADLIESRRSDVYTRPGSAAHIASYYAALGEDP
jgi:short-subunit dehydrogenase